MRLLFLILFILLLSCELPNPEQIRENQFLPEKGFIANSQLGEIKYSELCIQCHGLSAQGTTQGPPLVHKIYLPDHHADQAFRWAVRDGVKQHHWHFSDMPKIENATAEDVAHIIAYVREEQSKEEKLW